MALSVEDFMKEINKEMESYTNEVATIVNNAVEMVAKETNEEIKKRILFKQPTGKYVKSFRIDKTYDKKYKRVRTWYVANGEHRLTHLLEHGHAMPQGGRTREFPHIQYGETLATKRMEDVIMGALK